MMHLIAVDAVGVSGLAAFWLGFFVFVSALFAARRRANAGGREVGSARARASWIWIAVQGLGIASAAMGRVRMALDPYGAKALVEAAIILALMLATAALFRASSRAMGANWSIVARTRSDHVLVQTGPFAVVRNPIYVALFLLMVAMAIAYGHGRNLLVGVPLFALGTWFRVTHEETLLRRHFDVAYDAYAARVKRFVPGIF